jgi:hypothetical protein
MSALLLRRANTSRKGGTWQDDDFDVFDADRGIGRIYRVNASNESWFWGVSFQLTGRKSYGNADSLTRRRDRGPACGVRRERRRLPDRYGAWGGDPAYLKAERAAASNRLLCRCGPAS